MKLFRYSASIFNNVLQRQEDRINTIDEDALHRQLAFWNISARGKPLTQCFTELINKWNDRENHTYLSRNKITYIIDTTKVNERCQVDFV